MIIKMKSKTGQWQYYDKLSNFTIEHVQLGSISEEVHKRCLWQQLSKEKPEPDYLVCVLSWYRLDGVESVITDSPFFLMNDEGETIDVVRHPGDKAPR